MGAGASVEDAADCKKEYEKNGLKEKLNDEQRGALEATYEKYKDQDFLCVGRCKQAYAKLGLPDGDAAFADPLGKTKAAPAPEPEPEKPKQGPVAGGATRFKLADLPKVVADAVAAGKTPLILDPSEHPKVDTFYNYSSNGRVFDAKSMGLKHSLQGASQESCLEEARKAVVAAMKGGDTLVLACQQGAVDFAGKWRGDDTLPLALLRGAGVAFRSDAVARDSDAPMAKLFRDEDVADSGGFCTCGADFTVVVTSHFSSDLVDELLFETNLFPAKESFAIYEVDLSDE